MAKLELVSMRRLEQLLGCSRKDLQRIAEKAGSYYKPFDRRCERGRGKWRHIDNPTGDLKAIQRRIQRRILQTITLPETMTGGVHGRSIRDNALLHVGQPLVVTLDLRDCFPRTSDVNVFRVFRELVGCSPDIAAPLTKLTTFQHRLPQGAPTSSTLANLTLLTMHNQIAQIAASLGLQFGFYIDDIALSGEHALDAIEAVVQVIQENGHGVRRQKLLRMPAYTAQKVTGVLVNRKISTGSARVRELRRKIYELSAKPGIPDHGIRRIRGQISHVKWLCPVQGISLERLANRLLPGTGMDARKPRSDEIRPCRNTRRHRPKRQHCVN